MPLKKAYKNAKISSKQKLHTQIQFSEFIDLS